MSALQGKGKPGRSNAVAVLLAGIMVASAMLVAPVLAQSGGTESNSQGVDKVVAAGSKNIVFGPGAGVRIIETTASTSDTTDFILSVAMECSIWTGLITGPSDDGGSDTATATGTIRAWIEIDGVIAPINSAGNSPPGDDSDKVTFCDRTYSRTVTDSEDPLDGQDTEDDFIRTKTANSFHWLRLNLGHGDHTIVVKAELTETTVGDATAEAEIGNRMLIVEPVKLANNAVI